MPNILTHIHLGLQVQGHMRNQTVEREMGSFLLGCTTPDIRAMTRGDRAATHFSSYNCSDLRGGVREMFDQHPNLADSTVLPISTQAFIAGYICHLIADHAWVACIFEPYFDTTSGTLDPVVSKVMDRALQLRLDEIAAQEITDDVYATLRDTPIAVNIGFINPQALAEWQQWVMQLCDNGFSWDRLRFLAKRRQVPEDYSRATIAAEKFLSSIPNGLKELEHIVPRSAIERYRSIAIREAISATKGYLTCR
jgi:hypothetical protein